MISNYNYLDFLLLLGDIFLLGVVIISLCIYTIFEKNFSKLNSKINFFYSVAIYIIFSLNLYLFFIYSSFNISFYICNFTLSNINGMDFFKFFLVILVIFVFYASISSKVFNELKYVPFEFNYMLIFIFFGIIFLLYSFDFLMVFLTLELQNFSLYILMSMQRNKKIAVETGIRYYFLGVFLQV